MIEFFSKSEFIVAIITALITFFVGRCTSHLDDRRQGMKEINEIFYKPLISLYMNAHHSYAQWFVDLNLETQREIVMMLLENHNRVAPWIERKIFDLDQCYSSYLEQIQSDVGMTDEETEYVEKVFGSIYSYVEKQYKKNERRLYRSLPERIIFKVSEWKNG